MNPADKLILLADGVALDLGGDFARWAPGNDPRGAALNWLRSNGMNFYEFDHRVWVSQETAKLFWAAWSR